MIDLTRRQFSKLATSVVGAAVAGRSHEAGAAEATETEMTDTATPRVVMQHPRGRTHQSLNGPWAALVDPYDTGYYDYRRRPNPHGWFEDATPASPAALQEYDFDRAATLNVPGDWNTQRPELWLYEGSVWYRRRVTVPSDGARHFVWFGGANHHARVWLDGAFLGEHVGGFTPFEFEVTGVEPGQDVSLVVQVNAARRDDAVPTVATDWWNYGGLTRDVLWVTTGASMVRDWTLHLGPDGDDHLVGHVQVDGPPAPVRLRIDELGVDETIEVGDDGIGRIDLRAGIEMWSPDSPRRYDVRMVVGDDEAVDTIGFRRIETRGHDLLLNGEPIVLRGISIHEEKLSEQGGRATSDAHARELLAIARDLGCNFVRLAHYPHNEHMVRAADELGLLVWEEIPVYWTIAFDNEDTLANARQQLRDMVVRDRNRACTILWSVGNETPVSDARNRFLRTLVADVRLLDDTRLVTAALEQEALSAEVRAISDPLADDLDVLGLNEYLGWYDRLPGEFDQLTWEIAQDRPLVISEFGAGALRGLRGDAGERWTEDYQEAVYRDQVAMLSRVDALRGMSPWILKDFRSPRRMLPGIQDGWNRKGLVDETGERKAAFDVLRAFYAGWTAG